MSTFTTVLFDLDGTLTDPGVGITNSVAHALSYYGIEVEDKTTLYPFIGPPLAESFMRYFDFSEEKAKRAVDVYREYYAVRGIFENKLYEGVSDTLSHLYDFGITVALATSKPEVFAKKILTHFGIDRYFTYIGGSELDHKRTDKHEVIEYVLSNLPGAEREKTLMVGDTRFDIEGAAASSLSSIGVTYGYGIKEELLQAGAMATVDVPSQLLQFI